MTEVTPPTYLPQPRLICRSRTNKRIFTLFRFNAHPGPQQRTIPFGKRRGDISQLVVVVTAWWQGRERMAGDRERGENFGGWLWLCLLWEGVSVWWGCEGDGSSVSPPCSRKVWGVLFGGCLSAFFVWVRTELIVDRFIYHLEGCWWTWRDLIGSCQSWHMITSTFSFGSRLYNLVAKDIWFLGWSDDGRGDISIGKLLVLKSMDTQNSSA